MIRYTKALILAVSTWASLSINEGFCSMESTTGMAFVAVKGGCFEMGNPKEDGKDDEKPVHKVCVGDFAIGKYEVTRGQFRNFVEETGYRTEAEKGNGCFGWTGSDWEKKPAYSWRDFGIIQDDSHPVACVSWNDAVAFADWLTAREKKLFRLPTEAEWEYAARSGGKNELFAGGEDPLTVGWCSENSGHRSHPVGEKKANSLGIHDMTGNAWEWVLDWYDREYYRHSPRIDPKGPASGTVRVGRGGSWYGPAQHARTVNRSGNTPDGRIGFVGFRLVSLPQTVTR